MEIIGKLPLEAWTGILGVIIGSSLSVFGVWLSNKSSLNHLQTQLRHEKESHKNNLNRERLEELYILIGGWLNAIASNYLSLSMVMKGELSYDEYHDIVINSDINAKYDFNRLEMIVHIYAFSLKPEYEKILETRSELNEIAAKHKNAYKSGDLDGARYLKQFVSAQLKIEKLGEDLKDKIAEQVKSV